MLISFSHKSKNKEHEHEHEHACMSMLAWRQDEGAAQARKEDEPRRPAEQHHRVGRVDLQNNIIA